MPRENPSGNKTTLPAAAVRHSLPGNALFDEAFLACTSGHCIFDADGLLATWSDSFAGLYPTMSDVIRTGLHYRDWLRLLYQRSGIRNLGKISNIESWLDQQIEFIGNKDAQFIHYLIDERYVLIKHTALSNGSWLFAAFDITELQQMRKANAVTERKLQQFARLASDWFWELDENLRYRYHSSHKVPLGGMQVTDLVGKERIPDITARMLDNDQLAEHNNAILERRPLDVILTCVTDSGQTYHSHTVGLPQFDNTGQFTGYIGCGHDITESYTLKQQFEYQATHDELTGLWNRRAFGAYLKKLHENAAQLQPAEQTLLCIDLDKFKLVNDSAGHQAGDQLLRELADLFERVFGKQAILARLGGDEFGAVLPCNVDEAMRLSHGLIEKIGKHQFHWNKRKYSVGACIGVVAIDSSSRNSSDLLSKADIACYSAKESGRNQAQKYTTESTFQIQQKDELNKVQLLNNAINDGNVSLYLQPIVPTGDTVDSRVKFEVLLRIRDQNGEFLSSSDIIPVAEKYERMQHLDLWVTERTLVALEDLASLGVSASLSVNLSGNTLSSANTLTQIVSLVASHQIEPGSLCFEITETAAIANIEKVLATMTELRAMGCEFSLDDFGSGLSSFGYLKSLPVEYLKIDGSFVRNITEDRACRAIVTAFNTLSHEMGIQTVAEFVESEEIARLLTELDIDYLQGYNVGMPRDLDDWLNDYRVDQRQTGT